MKINNNKQLKMMTGDSTRDQLQCQLYHIKEGVVVNQCQCATNSAKQLSNGFRNFQEGVSKWDGTSNSNPLFKEAPSLANPTQFVVHTYMQLLQLILIMVKQRMQVHTSSSCGAMLTLHAISNKESMSHCRRTNRGKSISWT